METMQPGRELDALVATRVMGLEPWPGRPGAFKATIVRRGEQVVPCDPPEYSADIAAAWEVVEKLHPDRVPSFVLARSGGSWRASFEQWNLNAYGCEAPTAPHAICLAALRAVGAL